VAQHVDRPLGLSEVFAETIRLYGERIGAVVGLGLVYAAITAAGGLAGDAVAVAATSIGFAATFAAAARLAAGDGFTEAWSQVAVRLPVLLVLSVAVAAPFVIAAEFLLLLLFAAAWLALAGFAVPVAMLERTDGHEPWYARISRSFERAVSLARTDYLHAFGVVAALTLVYLLFGVILTGLLRGFADNSELVAGILTQVVLSPFFFLGLVVLYYEQRARGEAVEAHPSESL
jgi:hypothetical protein